MQKQISDFFEVRVLRKIMDVIATVSKPGTLFTDGAEMSYACRNTGQPAGFSSCCHVILSFWPTEISSCPS